MNAARKVTEMYWVKFHFMDSRGFNSKLIPMERLHLNRIPNNIVYITVETEDNDKIFIFGVKGRVSIRECTEWKLRKTIQFYGSGWTSCVTYEDADVYVAFADSIIKVLFLIRKNQKSSVWRNKKMIRKYAERQKFFHIPEGGI